jgi:hypothetical protein
MLKSGPEETELFTYFNVMDRYFENSKTYQNRKSL